MTTPRTAIALTSLLSGALLAYNLWPSDPTTATAAEYLVQTDGGPKIAIACAAGPAPDGGIEPGNPYPRALSTHTVPRGDLPDGVTVEVWPEGSHWPCATALPGATGCEEYRCEPGGGCAWTVARACTHLEPGQWRGDCRKKPCADPSELPVNSVMPVECRP